MKLHLCLLDRKCWQDHFRFGAPMRLHWNGPRPWFITLLSGSRRSRRIWEDAIPIQIANEAFALAEKEMSNE